MKIAGIIAEYNPFHSGHAWHIAETRRATGCDYIVCCMSGHMTQRGEFTCMSKWERARSALLCGADAVFELPALYAVRTADHFALGGVAILSGLGVDILSFGCETSDMDALRAIANLRLHEPEDFSNMVKQGLSQGKSHARAWGEAAESFLGIPEDIMNAPNAVLAAEYLCAIDRLSSPVKPLALPRVGSYHASQSKGNGFASAEAIRSLLREKRLQQAAACVPPAARHILECADFPREMDDLLLYKLRSAAPEALRTLPDVPEGLENRILKEAAIQPSRETLIAAVKSKRYTYARISRALAHFLIGLDAELAHRHPVPEYARLLGMRNDAAPLLTELSRRTSIPIVSSHSQLENSEVFALERSVTDTRSLLLSRPDNRRQGRENTEPFLRVSP